MRDIWKLKVTWDEDLPIEFVNRMNDLIKDLQVLDTIEFPRSVMVESELSELHVDCDASQEAYGACAYVVYDSQSELLMSKTRVAPLKARTILQMELTALLVGCRLVSYICSVIPAPFKKSVC